MLSCMTKCRKIPLIPISIFFSSCTVCLDPRLECHSWCTASWEGACFVPSWETSCWWSPQPQTTGCSTVCQAALPTRDCGGTACLASATCKPTASVGGTDLHGPFMHTAALFVVLNTTYMKKVMTREAKMVKNNTIIYTLLKIRYRDDATEIELNACVSMLKC